MRENKQRLLFAPCKMQPHITDLKKTVQPNRNMDAAKEEAYGRSLCLRDDVYLRGRHACGAKRRAEAAGCHVPRPSSTGKPHAPSSHPSCRTNNTLKAFPRTYILPSVPKRPYKGQNRHDAPER